MPDDTTSHVRVAYTREEAIELARDYLTETYGPPKDLSEAGRDIYHTHLGVMVALFTEMFPR